VCTPKKSPYGLFLANMRKAIAPTSTDQVKPPTKSCLTLDQLDEYWEERGMKYRIDTLHKACLSYGMNVAIDRPKFRSMLYGILRSFLVDGDSLLDPKKSPLPSWPKVGP
jgi:hypothetical protein